jgi:hypothetical protein
MNKEERKAIEYYQDKEISFGVNFDTEKLLRELGITEDDSFENHQIRFKTLLNLIEKLQKENEELKNKLLDTLKGQKVIKEETPQYIKENYITVQIVKDKIRHYQELQDNYTKKYDEINEGLQAMINVLQELIEERSDIYENM